MYSKQKLHGLKESKAYVFDCDWGPLQTVEGKVCYMSSHFFLCYQVFTCLVM